VLRSWHLLRTAKTSNPVCFESLHAPHPCEAITFIAKPCKVAESLLPSESKGKALLRWGGKSQLVSRPLSMARLNATNLHSLSGFHMSRVETPQLSLSSAAGTPAPLAATIWSLRRPTAPKCAV
jgi:hypothetical protein